LVIVRQAQNPVDSEERLEGIPAEERLEGLTPEELERLKKLLEQDEDS
jgi:septum formation topological specificity factor MinE